jgi:hypothetical protein
VKPTLKFDAAAVTADAGLAPLRELDERLGLTALAATLIDDLRPPEKTVHPPVRLVRETVYAYAAGHEDANDHTPLSADVRFREPVRATGAGGVNPKRHHGLASDPTISRLLGGRKLGLDGLGSVHMEWFARVVEDAPPAVVTLDIDARRSGPPKERTTGATTPRPAACSSSRSSTGTTARRCTILDFSPPRASAKPGSSTSTAGSARRSGPSAERTVRASSGSTR